MRKNSAEPLYIMAHGVTHVDGLNINFIADASTRIGTYGSNPTWKDCEYEILCPPLYMPLWRKYKSYGENLGKGEVSKDKWETHQPAPESCRNPSTREEVCYYGDTMTLTLSTLTLGRFPPVPQFMLLLNPCFWSSLRKQGQGTCLQAWPPRRPVLQISVLLPLF